MNESTNLVVSREDVAEVGMLNDLKNPTTSFFCSIENDGTRSSKVAIYNALNSDGESLIDHVGEVLEITDVAAHNVKLMDKETGEITETLRTVLVSSNGTTYSCVSSGVIESLKKVFAIVGAPSWKDEPVKMVPMEIKTRNGYRVLTLSLAV